MDRSNRPWGRRPTSAPKLWRMGLRCRAPTQNIHPWCMALHRTILFIYIYIYIHTGIQWYVYIKEYKVHIYIYMYYIIKSLLIALNWLILSIKIQGSSRHVSIAWCPVAKRVHDEKRCRGREKMAVEAIVPTEPWRPPRTTSRFRAILVWSSWKHPRGVQNYNTLYTYTSKCISFFKYICPNIYPKYVHKKS